MSDGLILSLQTYKRPVLITFSLQDRPWKNAVKRVYVGLNLHNTEVIANILLNLYFMSNIQERESSTLRQIIMPTY